MGKIRIEIRDGKIYADFQGYRGEVCETDARKLLEALSKSFEVRASVKRKAESEGTGVLA